MQILGINKLLRNLLMPNDTYWGVMTINALIKRQ